MFKTSMINLITTQNNGIKRKILEVRALLKRADKEGKLIEVKDPMKEAKTVVWSKGDEAEPREINRQGNTVEGNELVIEEKEGEEENYIEKERVEKGDQTCIGDAILKSQNP